MHSFSLFAKIKYLYCWLIGIKIYLPKKILAEHLADILLYTNPQVAEAIKDVGISGDFSQ